MPRRSLLVAVAGALVVVLLWYLLLWKPTTSRVAKARDDAVNAERQRDDLRDQLRRLRSSQRQEPLKLSQLATLKVAVPDDPNLAQFILDANDAATKAGIDFLSISPTPPSAAAAATTATTAAGGGGPAPGSIKLAMTIQGGYFQVLDFLNSLNSLPRIVVIDSLSLSGGSAAPLSVSISARMFTASAAQVSGAVTTTTAPGATTTTTPGATTTTVAGATTTSRPAGAP